MAELHPRWLEQRKAFEGNVALSRRERVAAATGERAHETETRVGPLVDGGRLAREQRLQLLLDVADVLRGNSAERRDAMLVRVRGSGGRRGFARQQGRAAQ